METLEDKLKREQNAALLDAAIASRKADKVSYELQLEQLKAAFLSYELRLEQLKAAFHSNEMAAFPDFISRFLDLSLKTEQISREIELLSELKNEVAPQMISEDTPF